MNYALIHPDDGFKVLMSTPRAQVASMTLAPGERTGGPNNHHKSSDQWLIVLSGEGQAVLNEQTQDLQANSVLLIQAGVNHEIRCTSDVPLVTANLYTPPEY